MTTVSLFPVHSLLTGKSVGFACHIYSDRTYVRLTSHPLYFLQVDELRGKLDHKNKLIEKKTQEALQVTYSTYGPDTEAES